MPLADLLSRFALVTRLVEVITDITRGRTDSGDVTDDARERVVERVPPMLLTIPEAASVLALGRTTLYELIAAGELEVVHVGRAARVPVDALRQFVEERRAGR